MKVVADMIIPRFNCLQHGDIRETLDSDNGNDAERDIGGTTSVHRAGSDTGTSQEVQSVGSRSDDDDDADFDIEKIINYSRGCRFPVELTSQPPLDEEDYRQGYDYTKKHKWNYENILRDPFIPCEHSGSCAEAQCRCFQEKIYCEKSCRCDPSCERRYPGCRCEKYKSGTVCSWNFKTGGSNCQCQKLYRECDPELCRGCGAAQVLDPENRNNDELSNMACRNVAIQRSIHKKTLLGNSVLHGFGLYVAEAVKMGDFLGEYTGEMISMDESNRRGVVYEFEQTMYTFTLNAGTFNILTSKVLPTSSHTYNNSPSK